MCFGKCFNSCVCDFLTKNFYFRYNENAVVFKNIEDKLLAAADKYELERLKVRDHETKLSIINVIFKNSHLYIRQILEKYLVLRYSPFPSDS